MQTSESLHDLSLERQFFTVMLFAVRKKFYARSQQT